MPKTFDRVIIRGDRIEAEDRDSVEGRWSPTFVGVLTPEEAATISAIVTAAYARVARDHARRRLAELDRERAHLEAVIGGDDA